MALKHVLEPADNLEPESVVSMLGLFAQSIIRDDSYLSKMAMSSITHIATKLILNTKFPEIHKAACELAGVIEEHLPRHTMRWEQEDIIRRIKGDDEYERPADF